MRARATPGGAAAAGGGNVRLARVAEEADGRGAHGCQDRGDRAGAHLRAVLVGGPWSRRAMTPDLCVAGSGGVTGRTTVLATDENVAGIGRPLASPRAAPLTRRGRRLAHGAALLTSGMGPRRGGRRHDLQLLLAPREPSPPCLRATHVAGAHPGHGRRSDRPCLDHGRTAPLSCPPGGGCVPAASDGRRRPGTHSATEARRNTLYGGRRITTVSWSATRDHGATLYPGVGTTRGASTISALS